MYLLASCFFNGIKKTSPRNCVNNPLHRKFISINWNSETLSFQFDVTMPILEADMSIQEMKTGFLLTSQWVKVFSWRIWSLYQRKRYAQLRKWICSINIDIASIFYTYIYIGQFSKIPVKTKIMGYRKSYDSL